MSIHRELIVQITAPIFFIIALILVPFLMIELIIVFVIRFIIFRLAKVFQPELCRPLESRSAHLASMGVYSSKPGLSIVVIAINTNKITLKEAQHIFQTKVLDLVDENGECRYPELLQYIFNWLWYPFWRWDRNFNLNNHISVMSPASFTKAELTKLRTELMSKQFTPTRSPWEFIIINNYVDEEYPAGPKFVMIFRVHHSLMDGLSMIKIFMDAFGTFESSKKLEEQLMVKSRPITESWVSKILLVTRIFFILNDLIYSTVDSFSLKPWGIRSADYTKEYICVSSDRISNNFIKNIKNGHSVSFTAVSLASLTAGIRKGLQINDKIRKIPDFVYVTIPLRVPGHGTKLRNHTTMAVVKLPVGEEDPILRLQLCQKHYMTAKRSLFPVGIFYCWSLFGSHFTWLDKHVVNMYFGGVNFSTLPGYEITLSHEKYQCLDVYFSYSMLPGSMGMGFSSLTYLGGYRLNIFVDTAVFEKQSDLQEILNAATKELDILHKKLL